MLGKVIIENGQKKIQALTADTGVGAPVGSYLYLEKKSNPQGYLYCDGSTFDETVYPALYQYLGTNVLPDWREMGAKGAEKNTTLIFDSTETDPRTGQAGTQNHDVFAQGEFKDDQLQDHKHKYGWKDDPAPSATVEVMDSASNLTWVGLPSMAAGNGGNPKFQIKGVYDGRVGDVTRGKSRAVFIYIKATSGLTENQQENVLNTINENNSYSTEEHPTGAKWIDGKPTYERVIEYGDGITALAQDTAITILDNVSIAKIIKWSGTAVYDNNVDYALPNNATIIHNNHTNITYSEHAMQSKKLYITIEYTKTTD